MSSQRSVKPVVLRFREPRQTLFTRATRRTTLHGGGMARENVTLSSANTHSYAKRHMLLHNYLDYVRAESLRPLVERRAANETC